MMFLEMVGRVIIKKTLKMTTPTILSEKLRELLLSGWNFLKQNYSVNRVYKLHK